MGLSFHYTFEAPASASPTQLEAFLFGVERLATGLGFTPTVVLNAPFDTSERREFARRLGGAVSVNGERVCPEYGVVLVVTDERGCESCFGFLRCPQETGIEDWVFRDFVDSPDPRYRQIVGRFQSAGYAKRVWDEFA